MLVKLVMLFDPEYSNVSNCPGCKIVPVPDSTSDVTRLPAILIDFQLLLLPLIKEPVGVVGRGLKATELKLVALPDKDTVIKAGLYKSVTEYIELVKAANEAVVYCFDPVAAEL